MKFLTLWQPWASLVAVGAKTIETRSWSTTYRGPLAIHAAKRRPDWSAMKELVAGHAWNEWYAAGLVAEDGSTDHIPLGAVVAVCDLVDVVPMMTWSGDLDGPATWAARMVRDADGVTEAILLRDAVAAEECIKRDGPLPPSIDVTDQIPFGDFTPGRFAWLLDNVRPLPDPVPMKGAQGLRDVPADVLAALSPYKGNEQ